MRIGFFGCSFTEGGGLDSFEWNDYALKNNLISDDWDITKLIIIKSITLKVDIV